MQPADPQSQRINSVPQPGESSPVAGIASITPRSIVPTGQPVCRNPQARLASQASSANGKICSKLSACQAVRPRIISTGVARERTTEDTAVRMMGTPCQRSFCVLLTPPIYISCAGRSPRSRSLARDLKEPAACSSQLIGQITGDRPSAGNPKSRHRAANHAVVSPATAAATAATRQREQGPTAGRTRSAQKREPSNYRSLEAAADRQRRLHARRGQQS